MGNCLFNKKKDIIQEEIEIEETILTKKEDVRYNANLIK